MFNWLNEFPGTNFHEMNIDWIVREIKRLAYEMKNFEIANRIKYAGSWDITKQYEAWSVVVDNNTGYISKQPVPKGISIDNTDYWELVANFTALIGDLGDRVTALENEDILINNAIGNLRNSNAYQNKRVVVFGDSYGYADYLDGTPYPNNGYIKLLKDRLHLSDDNYFYKAVPGARIYSASDSTIRMLNIAQGFESSVTDKNTIDLVIIQSGINDRDNSEYNIGTAWNDLATYIKATYPKARIVCFMTYGSFQDRDLTDSTFASQSANVYAGYCWGCHRNDVCLYTESSYPLAFKSNFWTDNYHPNANGQSAICDMMCSKLLGSDEYFYGGFYQEIDSSCLTITNEDVTAATIYNGYAWHKDNRMCVYNNPGQLSITLNDVGINCNGTASIEIGYFNNIRLSVNGLGWNECHDYPCIVQDTNGDFHAGTVMFDFRLGKVLARLYVPTDSGYLDASTLLTKIYFCPSYTEFKSYPW